jgi:feruloyl esterase
VAVSAATLISPAPSWTPPAGQGPGGRPVTQSFCRVEGTIEGRVGFELWLPPKDRWNGRLLGAGVGGDAGVYNYRDLARGVEAGYAAVTNDSGHKVAERNWMMREEAVLDYTHRSQHMMNTAARALIAKHYAEPPHHAYFIGCSGGGRQALKEMQRFPEDYDGVIAGAGGPRMPVMSVRHLWQAVYQEQNPAGAMTDALWDVVAAGAVQACDADDGVHDGVVENPARCRFDPGTLQCADVQTSACLSAAQVQTVRAFYAPLRDEDGAQLDSGLMPGVRTRPGPPSPLLLPLFAQGAHRDLTWTAARFHRGRDLALVNQTMPEMRADNPDVAPFVRRGGKAILYQGWLDPSVVAGQSIDYYDSVRARLGATTDRSVRLFMVPGMLHCRGGAGVDQFGGSSAEGPIGDADHDVLSALVRWVEQGRSPDSVIASRLQNGAVTMQRRLCPYPQVAKYSGGDANSAESFSCVAP